MDMRNQLTNRGSLKFDHDGTISKDAGKLFKASICINACESKFIIINSFLMFNTFRKIVEQSQWSGTEAHTESSCLSYV